MSIYIWGNIPFIYTQNTVGLFVVVIQGLFGFLSVSSISRVLRARFGKKDDDDDSDKKDEDGEKKTKHSIDGILGDKGRPAKKNMVYFAINCE